MDSSDLTAKVGTGSAPSGSYPVNAGNNRLTGETYDNNGNIVRAGWSYDYENRLMWGGGKYFLYDSSNRKVWEQDPVTGYETITFYGVDGKRMADYGPVERASDFAFGRGTLRVYFAGKRLAMEDRLGSSGNGRYFFSYGATRNSAPNAEFATYQPDTTLGLQYAINRWYMPGQGRFTTAAPYPSSALLGVPSTWNRFSYTSGDSRLGFWSNPAHWPSGWCNSLKG
ncbi:MAG: hypothetical protein HY822_14790 [Acidobacteria bacterium]|nr:hypothetical protein [Acidobacteriota bacterium]